jgi:uncharacterized membrane protein
MGVLEDYFFSPIADKTGYNIVNTLAYAAVAIGALYAIYTWMERKKVALEADFWKMLILFVVFGSATRVLTDSVDSGAMAAYVAQNAGSAASAIYNAILQSHALDYGYWTVTPGIYIVTAALFLCTLALCRSLENDRFGVCVGVVFAALPVILLMPMAVHMLYAIAIIALAGGAALAAKVLLKFDAKQTLPVFAHAFDGAATWVAINWFGPEQGVNYFEQHVLSGGIGNSTPLGFGMFFALKVAFASAAVYFLTKKDGKDEVPPLALELTLAAITVLGLAPGLRDTLRLLLGT